MILPVIHSLAFEAMVDGRAFKVAIYFFVTAILVKIDEFCHLKNLTVKANYSYKIAPS
jgi:hypothetical protein